MTAVLPSETFPYQITQSLMSVSKFDMKSEWPVGVSRVVFHILSAQLGIHTSHIEIHAGDM